MGTAMTTIPFPNLDSQSFVGTRDALQAYAQVLGAWLNTCRSRRKHWWHVSLRPSLNGLTTNVIHAGIDFELELNLRENLLYGRTSKGETLIEELRGQPATELAEKIQTFLIAVGIDGRFIPQDTSYSENEFVGYSAEHAVNLFRVLNSVTMAMESFQAGIREETSPIQLWPHHFDLSMLWLPGEKVADQDPANEEYADKQMNFGFTFGDAGIPEPYFYVTAYPLPDVFPTLQLPAGTSWQNEGFSGAVLLYQSLLKDSGPTSYLINLWNTLLSAGRKHLLENQTEGSLR
jgi:hypothetical protein